MFVCFLYVFIRENGSLRLDLDYFSSLDRQNKAYSFVCLISDLDLKTSSTLNKRNIVVL